MKTVHYLNRNMSILESTGVCACGIYVSTEKYGDNMTSKRKNVTCGNCKRSNSYKQKPNRQACNYCGKIVGCNYKGKKHKCACN